MTPLSLVPEQARHLGMSYAELVEAIVDEALHDGRGMSRTIKRGTPPRKAPPRRKRAQPRARSSAGDATG